MNINKIAVFVAIPLIVVGFLLFSYTKNPSPNVSTVIMYTKPIASSTPEVVAMELPTHVKTPSQVKAVYMSSWSAGSNRARARMIKMIDDTELNAVVIDVKDSTGIVSFEMDDPLLRQIGPFENRISDIAGLMKDLHSRGIYVIARIAVFEDPHLARVRPELAIKRKSDGKTWKDRKGLAWTDIGSKEVWDYNIAVAEGAYGVGFDELNFDYIRFPSDGDMNNITYPSFEGRQINKAEELRNFFEYLNLHLKEIGAPLSADLFGMTMTNTDDLNIGQILEYALPYFDYIAPMVYPSHYPPRFNGYKKPAEVPYELIKFVMGKGVERSLMASSTPDKLRPWLQDFDLGAVYTKEMVRAQITATNEVGLKSWMLWDPANQYTPSALEEN